MTVTELKKYIYNENKVDYILEKLGCGHIVYHRDKEYFSASHSDGDNPQGINIKNTEYLNYRSHSRNISYDDKQDIINLVEYNQKCEFKQALKYIHNLLDVPFTYKKEVKTEKREEEDPLYIFKKITHRRTCNVLDINPIDENELNDFIPLIHIDWFRKGIMPWTVKKFGLAYSYKHKRNVIPLRYWLNGELLGFNQRTTVENYELFDITKYFITQSYPKHINLFGLWENKETIQKAGYVVVYESEKSPLIRHSLNDGTGVALSGHSISDEQVRILIGLNVEVIIALDNDIDINEIRMICEKFYGIRKVSYIYDKWGLIPEKSCAADCRNQIFEFLMKYRKVYDVYEHNEYLKSLKRK